MSLLKRNFPGPNRSTSLALLIIAFAFVVRVLLISSGWPATTSEEGTFGLEAMHIAFRGEFPVFMYGQSYMGTLEAYLGAVYFHLFGISLFSLRLGMLTLFSLFLLGLYALTKLLYSSSLALFTLVLLSVGSQGMLLPEMMVLGGTTETLLFGTLLLLLATHLALTSGSGNTRCIRRLRSGGFAAWGCCAGLGLWSHLLVAPFILVSGFLLVMFCRKDLKGLASLYLLSGFLVGSFPLILYNLVAPFSQNSVATFWSIYTMGNPAVPDPLFVQKQISGTFLFSLPVATGLNTLCDVRRMAYFSTTPTPLSCTLAQGGWSLGYLILLGMSLYLACRGLVKLRTRAPMAIASWSDDERPQAVIYWAQIMLLCGAALTLVLFVHSPNSASRPWSTRYLVGLLIATPALLWPLWKGVGAGLSSSKYRRAFAIGRWLLLGLLVGLFATETLFTTRDLPAIRTDSAEVQAVTQGLLQRGIIHIYSGYWQCDRFIFQTREKLTCAVLNDDLSPGLTRYTHYVDSVRADAGSAYVFPRQSLLEVHFEHYLVSSRRHFQKILLGSYIVWLPGG